MWDKFHSVVHQKGIKMRCIATFRRICDTWPRLTSSLRFTKEAFDLYTHFLHSSSALKSPSRSSSANSSSLTQSHVTQNDPSRFPGQTKRRSLRDVILEFRSLEGFIFPGNNSGSRCFSPQLTEIPNERKRNLTYRFCDPLFFRYPHLE